MTKSTGEARVQALLPQTLRGNVRYAPGVRAGRWIFATGHKGTADYASGMASEVLRAHLPHWDTSKLRREADQIFRNLDAVHARGRQQPRERRARRPELHLRARGRGVSRCAARGHERPHPAEHLDARRRLPPAAARRSRCTRSASRPKAISARATSGPKGQDVHHTSGYSLALEAGDLVFVAGRMADSLTFGEGLAKEARLPDEHLWKGLPIKLEAEFILREKIEPALKAAGSSLENVVKCQVYMRDPDDFGAVQRRAGRSSFRARSRRRR